MGSVPKLENSEFSSTLKEVSYVFVRLLDWSLDLRKTFTLVLVLSHFFAPLFCRHFPCKIWTAFFMLNNYVSLDVSRKVRSNEFLRKHIQ